MTSKNMVDARGVCEGCDGVRERAENDYTYLREGESI
jgi:hypothetical protein